MGNIRREKNMITTRFKKTTVSVLVALSLSATGVLASDQMTKPAGAKGTGMAKAFQAKNNQFWWPDQLDLSPLRDHDSRSNPLGDNFNYAKAFSKLDLDQVKKDINELLKRHETLEDNKSALVDETNKLDEIVESHKKGYLEIHKEKSNTILLLNNEISQLQQQKEQLEQEMSQLETSLEGNTKGAFEENVFFGKIFMAIDNLATRCIETKDNIKIQKNKNEPKKGDKKESGNADQDKDDKKDGKMENPDNDAQQLLKVDAAVRKLGIVADNISDFLKIVNHPEKKEKAKKVYGIK